jgi:HSP20 family protein
MEKTMERQTQDVAKDVMKSSPIPVTTPFSEFDQWFDDVRRNWMSPLLLGRGWPDITTSVIPRMPRVDVIDRADEICVRAELPGVDKSHLEVTLNEDALSIHATRHTEETEEKGLYHRREMSHGEFTRTLRLPCPVESEKAKAKFQDGILDLTLPKSPGFRPRTIKVE